MCSTEAAGAEPSDVFNAQSFLINPSYFGRSIHEHRRQHDFRHWRRLGIGAACARHFASLGGNVLIADVQVEAGEKLAAELGQKVRFARTDVTDEGSVQAALAAAKQQFGAVNVVINCAGIIGAGRVVGKEGPYDLASFSRTIQVNLIGTFNVIRLASVMMSANTPTPSKNGA